MVILVNPGQLRLFSALGTAIRVLASSSMAFHMLIFMRHDKKDGGCSYNCWFSYSVADSFCVLSCIQLRQSSKRTSEKD
ncbi:hypothetical protein OIU84_007737 [Salix udensis]|uniref:Uncharacterized protein n=1 Tax=Salix udensis TaxID=889485 RepID=A0AAD6NZW7_9ROSI|nr:hypothetical protein OIU84_007737 [Salix udensis]